MTASSCGWSGTVREFLATGPEALLDALANQHRESLLEPPGKAQVNAWVSETATLRRCFTELSETQPSIGDYALVFEYELPRERGRRPDVVLLSDREAFVLEFKEADTPVRAYLDQAAAYARDLRAYHAASRDLRVKTVLVLVRSTRPDATTDGVSIVSGATLTAFFKKSLDTTAGTPDLDGWLASEYAPLPTIVAAARTLFHHEKLPTIRRAAAAGIPATLDALLNIVERARANHEHHLVVITGVPGSGKTLLGLQLAYSDRLTDDGRNEAVFLSGNGPLVEVLQDALHNKVFVQDVHGFLKEYGGASEKVPAEHVLVYDEAQRAWDRNKANEKRGARLSQPEDFIHIAEREHDWGAIVILLGEGQEIHVGEEAGLRQWEEAVAGAGRRWTVHGPARLAESFPSAREIDTEDGFDLTASLRSHLAEDVTRWTDRLLEGHLAPAGIVAKRNREQGFELYLARDLEQAKEYARTRYASELDKRYGLLASSKARDLEFYGIKNDFYATRKVKTGSWYNAEADDPLSCCALTSTVTEFGCQGLELDLPIIGWGSDMQWDGGAWRTPMSKINARNPRILRLNSYRVLLSRGRDGMVIFVPPAQRYEPTAKALLSAGLIPL